MNSRLSVGPAEIESNGNEAGAERVDLLEAEMERLPKRRGYLGVASSVAMHGLLQISLQRLYRLISHRSHGERMLAMQEQTDLAEL